MPTCGLALSYKGLFLETISFFINLLKVDLAVAPKMQVKRANRLLENLRKRKESLFQAREKMGLWRRSASTRPARGGATMSSARSGPWCANVAALPYRKDVPPRRGTRRGGRELEFAEHAVILRSNGGGVVLRRSLACLLPHLNASLTLRFKP